MRATCCGARRRWSSSRRRRPDDGRRICVRRVDRRNERSAGTPPIGPAIVAYAHRERTQIADQGGVSATQGARARRAHFEDFDAAFKTNLVDAALVDLGGAQDETWRVAALAREYPSIPFFGLVALRAAEGPALAQCAACEFTDVLVDGVDDGVARELVQRSSFSTRFARALHDPPTALMLDAPLQQSAWRFIVSHAGRPVRTSTLASFLNVTREHLSRSFAADNAPNLKRIIDLVRIVAAAELAKNPGLRSARRREHPRVCIPVASFEHGASGDRDEAGVAHETAHDRSRRAVRERARPQPRIAAIGAKR